MKRNTSSLNEKDWKKVEKWLKGDRKMYNCPWRISSGIPTEASRKCKDLFPNLEPLNRNVCCFKCPCFQYNLTYVVKVAKRLLKEMRAAQE